MRTLLTLVGVFCLLYSPKLVAKQKTENRDVLHFVNECIFVVEDDYCFFKQHNPKDLGRIVLGKHFMVKTVKGRYEPRQIASLQLPAIAKFKKEEPEYFEKGCRYIEQVCRDRFLTEIKNSGYKCLKGVEGKLTVRPANSENNFGRLEKTLVSCRTIPRKNSGETNLERKARARKLDALIDNALEVRKLTSR